MRDREGREKEGKKGGKERERGMIFFRVVKRE